MEYYDISPEITEKIAVFPGDTAYSHSINRCIDKGDGYTLSHIKTTVHLGAHTDAPNHYVKDGQDIASRDLNFYYGKAQVIAVKKNEPKYRITVADIQGCDIKAQRILFRTDSFTNPDVWTDDFTALEPQVIEYLAEKNVRLIGIDTPSVDLAEDANLLCHQMIAKYDMAILEGVVLTHIQPGIYHLCALPLRLKKADASPVRAILIKE